MQSTYPLIPVILYASMWWLDDQWMEIHVKEGNASGTNHTSANISKFFLGNASQRRNTKSWKVCYKCKIAECKTTNQVIALFPSLPSLLPFKAFPRVAFDFGEPFLTIQGNDRKRQIIYLCSVSYCFLFTLVTSWIDF